MPHFKLLSKGNPKLEKSLNYGWASFVLHLSPSNISGHNVCPMATAGCRAACLNTAGRGAMITGKRVTDWTTDDLASGKVTSAIHAARLRKTERFFKDRAGFFADLVSDIRAAKRWAAKHGLKLAIRLNGTSDIRWERFPVGDFPNIFAVFPDVQFYDYTKIVTRHNLPDNYHLTFSAADGNDDDVAIAMAKGWNVAVVFRNELPDAWNGRIVIDGDKYDLRFLDVRPVIVGLKAKGRARYDRSGFVKD